MASPEEEKNIYLKVTKTIALKVKMSETIKNLKSIVRVQEGISENLQELFFAGERLKDDRKMVDYGIQANSTVHLVVQSPDSMKLLINISSQERTLELEAKTNHTIQNIKSMIFSREGIQPECYSLLCGGKLLEDGRTLASLNIQAQSILYLVFNPKDKVSISVKMPTGEIVRLEVKVLYTICDVKMIIGSVVGISFSDHHLFYAGQQLVDSKSLAFYNIGENHVLEILPPTFQIFVKDWSGKTITVNLCQEDTVWVLKHKIFKKLGMPVEVQSLVFAGKRLEDDRDLASYNIQKDSTVHMVYWPATHVRRMKFSDIGYCVLGLPKETSIFNLKAFIQKILINPVRELFIDGMALQDHLSMAYYAIEKDTELMIALEVR